MQETQEMWVQSPGWEDLEQEMATYSSILAWKIPRTEKPDSLQSMESQSQKQLSMSTHITLCSHPYSHVENVRGKLYLKLAQEVSGRIKCVLSFYEVHNKIHICIFFTLCKLFSYQFSHAIFITILQIESGRQFCCHIYIYKEIEVQKSCD